MRLLHIIMLVVLFSSNICSAENIVKAVSPDGKMELTFELIDGVPNYSIKYCEEKIIVPSSLGLQLANQNNLENFYLEGVDENSFHEVWQPVWGKTKNITNEYSEITINLKEIKTPNRRMRLIFRVFNDGVAFRYHIDKQNGNNFYEIKEENSFCNFASDFISWWTPNDYDTYEHEYRTTKLSKVHGVNTPFTMQTKKGTCVVIHEAELISYSGLTLERDFAREYSFKSVLVPSPDGVKVKREAPFNTPWRVIIIAENPARLLESNMILNLNPAPADDDLSWIKPVKYVGVWWEMHLGKTTWTFGDKHGANNKNVKRYINFAADNNMVGVLVEGWNKGWEEWGEKDAFSFTECYPDFDIKELTNYASSKGVEIIGHHETGGDVLFYENQIDDAFDFYKANNIRMIKTGYAGPIRPTGYHHHGQFMVDHYNMVVKKAFEIKIMLDVHEPIQMTGLSRTYPNLLACEGVRGMEYNAWSSGNKPEHTTILPFTRNLAGPIDYTPGIFDLKYDQYKKEEFVKTTLAKQLALYITIYSPFQMAADLIENYDKQPAFQFIKDVPVEWDTSVVINAVIGDYVTIARKNKGKWFVGSITDENERELIVPLNFLDPGNYIMKSYADGENAHYIDNPYPVSIKKETVAAGQDYVIKLAPGGGFAAELIKCDD